jgi:subtilisin family serine protease
MTGTSMASPYVCGVVALMLAAHPSLTAAQVQGIMRATSTPLIGHNFSWRKDAGFGLVDADRCVEEAAGYNAGLPK